jgi:beta-galactosidase
VFEGENPVFKVAVRGTPPFDYQWRFNGINIAGATNASLLLSNVTPADAGVYSVVASNAFGTVTSSDAVLTVPPPPLQFRTGARNLQMTSNGFKLQVVGSTGTGVVVIYGSTNLVDWLPIFTNSPTSGTVQFIDSAAGGSGTRFYRAEQR